MKQSALSPLSLLIFTTSPVRPNMLCPFLAKTLRNLSTATQLVDGGVRIQAELCVTEATMPCSFLPCQLPAKLEVIFLVPLTLQASKTDRPTNVQTFLQKPLKSVQAWGFIAEGVKAKIPILDDMENQFQFYPLLPIWISASHQAHWSPGSTLETSFCSYSFGLWYSS